VASATITVTLRVNTLIPRVAGAALRPFAYLGFSWPTAAFVWIAQRTTFFCINGRWHRMTFRED